MKNGIWTKEDTLKAKEDIDQMSLKSLQILFKGGNNNNHPYFLKEELIEYMKKKYEEGVKDNLKFIFSNKRLREEEMQKLSSFISEYVKGYYDSDKCEDLELGIYNIINNYLNGDSGA